LVKIELNSLNKIRSVTAELIQFIGLAVSQLLKLDNLNFICKSGWR
jgi:hypothetical protein